MRCRRLACLALCLAAAACAPKQRIALDCVPHDVVLFVDKERIDEIPPELVLSADEGHYLYFKREGYQPVPVVLHPEETETGPRLSPSNVCDEVHFVELERGLELEIEDSE